MKPRVLILYTVGANWNQYDFFEGFFFCCNISFWQKFTFFNPNILHYGLPLIFRCSRVHFGSQVASCWYLRAQKTRTQIVHGKIKKISGKPWPRNFGQKNRFHIVKTSFILTVTTKSNLHPPPSHTPPILIFFKRPWEQCALIRNVTNKQHFWICCLHILKGQLYIRFPKTL